MEEVQVSMSSGLSDGPLRAYLDYRLGSGQVTRRLLTETRLVVGRMPGLQLTLDHHTVSRRHAELYCDPFARWWVRDLGSTNGTLVNDERVTERVLQPGDWVRIGDYILGFHLESQGQSRASSEPRAPLNIENIEEEKPTAIRKLGEFEAPRLAAKHLFTLMDLSRRLIGIEDPAERLHVLCQLVIRDDFHGNLAMALRLRKGGALTMLSGPHRPPHMPNDEPPYISRRVLNALEETREPVLAGNSMRAPVEITMSREVMAMWVVACPISRGEEVLDILYVTLPPECGSVEWLGLISFAAEVYQQGESAWAARRHAQAHASIERELDMARQIQRGVVPKNVLFDRLDVAIGFEPCKWVGGDYADVVPMPDGRTLLAVADVCGKGLQAALIASSLHTMVRATVEAGRSVTDLMERLNRHLCEYLPEHSFVTMIALVVDVKAGKLECVNAGHPPAFIIDGAGSVRYLQDAMNPALGMGPVRMDAEVAILEQGEVLAMYTDGLTELRNAAREMLGEQQLGIGFARICASSPEAPMTAIAQSLVKMLEEYGGDQLPEDDRAFILARRK